MSDDKQDSSGYLVTPKLMYEKLIEIDAKVTVLMERDRLDHERLKNLEDITKWLQRTVYAIGIPVVALISGYEAVTRFMT
jgi:hypothetical protein